MNTAERIMAYESGDMSDDQVPEFFQALIDSGLVWELQGCYGRTAERLILDGTCHRREQCSVLQTA